VTGPLYGAPRLLIFLVLAVPMNPWVSKSSKGTLFFVGSTSTSIVVAADGLVTDDGVPIGIKDKLMPLGNVGECFIGGDSRIGSGKGEVDLEKTVRDWIRANPTAALPTAHEAMDATLSALMKASRRAHPEWYPNDPTQEFSYFICVGYYMGLQQFYASVYTATPQDITSTPRPRKIPPGRFKPFGLGKVCTEIVTGNAGKLSQFKSDPAVTKYRRAAASDNLSSISTNDLLRLGRVCIEATESPAGRKFDPDAKRVGPPNHYVVIDQRQGLKTVGRP
jgi:hypothetical protein